MTGIPERPHGKPSGFPPGVVLAGLGACALLIVSPGVAWGQCESLVDSTCGESFSGTIDFFATGGSFAFNDDADDRPDGLLDVGEVAVGARRIPPRAELVQAFLFFGGSLYFDADGTETPDQDVEIRVPGSDDFIPVRGDRVYESNPIPGFPEVILYSVRADITDIMRDAGGEMVGTYQVRGFDADIFDGTAEHTAANASFSIILIFEEPRLPPRNIVLFEGLEEVLGSTITLDLEGFIVSEVPSGTLTMYALEGDCNPGPEDCENGNNLSGGERIRVIGADNQRTRILQDDFNPPNDIFNRTINTVDPPLRNVPGTDIDSFDITPVLRTGDDRVTVEVTSPLPRGGNSGELIGMVYVIVGIDVFGPNLREDSRIEIRTERGEKRSAYYPGDPLRVTYALSNTGNLRATGVTLRSDLPSLVTRHLVLEAPESSTVSDDPTGGEFAAGQVSSGDISVRHGEVNDLVLLIETECPLPEGGTLEITAIVGPANEGGSEFVLTSSTALLPREICGPRFFLFGGGGCRTSIESQRLGLRSLLPLLLLLGVLLVSRGRRFFASLLIVVASAAFVGCGSDDPGPDRPAPAPGGVGCPDQPGMVVVPSIRGRPFFCVDQFEASIASGALGNPAQPPDGDGSTTAAADSVRFTPPAAGVTWHQAKAACENAGKRLCTAEEWSTACRGASDVTYPYGDTYDPTSCNGFDAIRGAAVETGAMIVPRTNADGRNEAGGCVSEHGIYDLSGNVWEWNADAYFEGRRRGLAGGSFRSNRIGLRCVTEDNHALPDEENNAFGFRCCVDYQGE